MKIEVVEWQGELRCIYLNDRRIAGAKPWGGGKTIYQFQVSTAKVRKLADERDAASLKEKL